MEPLYMRIKYLRESLNMSQQELAELTGYTSRSSIAKIEKGEVNLPLSKISTFAKALKSTPTALMGWDTTLGDDQSNLDYLKDKPELLELYKDIKENENLIVLLDKAKTLEPNDLEQILRIIDTFKKK